MQTQLKFRVWDKLEKRFIYPDKGYQGHYVLDLNGRFQNLQNGSGGDEYVVQQFTGFKDKNGKDIYDGDIISVGFYCAGEYGVVKFGEYCGKDYYSNDGCGWFVDHGFDVHAFVKNWAYESSVVGNIFEHPELLEASLKRQSL
jgi:uncharacterized phage protein (TIGR01671 family)